MKIPTSILLATLAIFGLNNTVRAQTIAAGVYHSVSLCSDGTVTCLGW